MSQIEGQILIDIMNDHGLEQLVNFPTRERNTLDLILMARAQGGGGTLIFCGYIGEAPASYPKPKKLLRFADHPKKIPVLSGIPKKILELLAYPKKITCIHLFYAY